MASRRERMRRWEALVDMYLTGFRRRGLSEDYIKNTGRELDRWGAWLKRRRPRPRLEDVSSEMIIRYIRSRTVCRAKATVYGVVSKLRGMGDLLVKEGIWRQNHLKWIRGPKLDPRSRVPRRIKKVHLEKLLVTAAGSSKEQIRNGIQMNRFGCRKPMNLSIRTSSILAAALMTKPACPSTVQEHMIL
jgi:site-specific recombinase XerD